MSRDPIIALPTVINLTDAEIQAKANAIGALMKDCADVDHRLALLAWGVAVTLLPSTPDQRQQMLFSLGQCINIQVAAMETMMGRVGAARLQ